mgnify:CR=1 FL=1
MKDIAIKKIMTMIIVAIKAGNLNKSKLIIISQISAILIFKLPYYQKLFAHQDRFVNFHQHLQNLSRYHL